MLLLNNLIGYSKLFGDSECLKQTLSNIMWEIFFKAQSFGVLTYLIKILLAINILQS